MRAITVALLPRRAGSVDFGFETVAREHVPVEVAHAIDVVEQWRACCLPDCVIVAFAENVDVCERCNG